MPPVLIVGPYQFRFYSIDADEREHIHVERDKFSAKFWLTPEVSIARNYGFKPAELNKIRKITTRYREFLLEKWNEYFPGN